MTHKIAPDLLDLATPVADLYELPGNPRDGDARKLALSYDQFGQTKPIVIWSGDTDGTRPEIDGKLVVLDGNHQLKGARDILEWSMIAAHDMTGTWSWTEALAYALAANPPELNTDPEKLLNMYRQVADHDDATLTAATGHDDETMLRMVAQLSRDNADPETGQPADYGDRGPEFYPKYGDEPEETTVDDLAATTTNQCPSCEFQW